MGTRWEKLAGDTSKFAIKLAFSDDPDSGQSATREESASWGGLQIWVDDVNSDGKLDVINNDFGAWPAVESNIDVRSWR